MNNNIQNTSFNQMNENNNPIDLFPYIKEEKKLIIFINSDNNRYYIKIPVIISKFDLYSIASNYKALPYSNIILSYKNIWIKNEESSIEEIPNGAEINIIEERYIPNNIYSESLLKKYGNNDIAYFYLELSNGKKQALNLPRNALVSEVVKTIYFKFGADEKNLKLLSNGKDMRINDKRKIKDIYNGNIINATTHIPTKLSRDFFGKRLVGNLKIQFKGQPPLTIQIVTGTLESTTNLFEQVECMYGVKIQKLYLNNVELIRKYEKSLLSMGIKDNFSLKAEMEKS